MISTLHRWSTIHLQDSDFQLTNKNKEPIVNYRKQQGWKAPASMGWQGTEKSATAILVSWPAALPPGEQCLCRHWEVSTKGRKCITITKLPSMEELYVQGCRNKANQILMGPQHLSVRLFQLLPFGRWYRSIRAWLNRRKNSGSSAIRNPNC